MLSVLFAAFKQLIIKKNDLKAASDKAQTIRQQYDKS
jgi:hypothetical protein